MTSGKRKEELDRLYVKQKDGSYKYIGELYCYDASEVSWKKALTRLWLCTAAAAAAQIAAGCIPETGMVSTWYVLLPYAFALCTAFYLIYKMINLPFGSSELKEDRYSKTIETFDAAVVVVQFLSVLTASTEVILLDLSGCTARYCAHCPADFQNFLKYPVSV